MDSVFNQLSEKYRSELLDNIIPFWERHFPDKENGGYFTCLDRQGRVYDTDKFIWLQVRQVWVFASLYNNIEKNDKWKGCFHIPGGLFQVWKTLEKLS